MSDLTAERLNLEDVIGRIERQAAETRKLVAEREKIIAEQWKLFAERDKLAAEALKLARDRSLAPYIAITSALLAVAAGSTALLGYLIGFAHGSGHMP